MGYRLTFEHGTAGANQGGVGDAVSVGGGKTSGTGAQEIPIHNRRTRLTGGEILS